MTEKHRGTESAGFVCKLVYRDAMLQYFLATHPALPCPEPLLALDCGHVQHVVEWIDTPGRVFIKISDFMASSEEILGFL